MKLWRKFRALFSRRRLEREMAEEMQTHIDELTERNLAGGLSPEEARYAALRAFGGVEQIKERARDVRGWGWIDWFNRDIRFACRMLASHRWFSAAVIMTLALGIGINTTVFTLVNAVLFKPLPIPGGERLVTVMGMDRNKPNRQMGISYSDFLQFRTQNHTFEGLEAASLGQAVISGKDEFPAQISIGKVTAGMFDLLSTPPILGRGFSEADDRPGAEVVMLIGYSLWMERYGGVPDVIGRGVRINGLPATIIGVMPEGFAFPKNEDLWIPLGPTASIENRSRRYLQLFGLLKTGTSIKAARADMSVIAKRLAIAYPDAEEGLGITVHTFQEAYNGPQVRAIFFMMLGAAMFVLFIACANVANLMLSRAAKRTHELTMRVALGASRGRLIHQLLTESMLLSCIGGLAGLGLAKLGVHAFDLAVQGVGKPYWIVFSMDYATYAYFAAISIGSGVMFGLLPALRATKVDLNTALKDDTSGAGKNSGGRMTTVLVVGQFALTLVLLAGAGLMIRSFMAAQAVNSFVPAQSILTAQFQLPWGKGERYADPERRLQVCRLLLERLATLPGVTRVALASNLPGLGSSARAVEIEGLAQHRPSVSVVVQSPGYLSLIGLPIFSGRGFTASDGEEGKEAVVVTRAFAAKFWPGESTIGRRFRFVDGDEPQAWMTVVGVCENLVQEINTAGGTPLVFIPYRQQPLAKMSLLLLTGSAPSSLVIPLRATVQRLDPDLPLTDVQTLSSALRHENWFLAVFGTLFSVFSATGLLMAAVGVYGVVAQITVQRTREIGIRMALGASVASVVRLVLMRGLAQLLTGLLLGVGGAIGVMQLLAKSELFYHATPNDPLLFAAICILLVAVGSFACWLPARRAAKVDPMEALRCE